MSTTFEQIYDIFLSQIDDVDFLNYDEDDAYKLRYLLNSIPQFKSCRNNLTDREQNGFSNTLTDEEQFILGNLMVLEYLKPRITSLKNISQSMSTRDFSMTSQANHLKQLSELKKDKSSEVDSLIISYTYTPENVSKLK